MTEELYPCSFPSCKTMRTEDEGGKIFTSCDEHFDKCFDKSADVFLTVCFYEFPVANDDISAWANKFEKYIIKKDEFEWQREIIKIFVIKKQDSSLEFVVCIKMDSKFFDKIDEMEKYLERTMKSLFFNLKRFEYLKTIIFGKVDNKILRNIMYLNDQLEFLSEKKIKPFI